MTQSADDDAYEQKRIALAASRLSMLTERVTYSVVQARLREAAIEQAGVGWSECGAPYSQGIVPAEI